MRRLSAFEGKEVTEGNQRFPSVRSPGRGCFEVAEQSEAPRPNWCAKLALQYERRGERSVLATRRFDGPLVVQKPLYPEGDAVCHTIVVHPPGGIAGGDELDIDIRADERAHALLTTPGAGKWYRSGGPWARMRVAIDGERDACVEWLPQETIVFDGALADIETQIRLGENARFIGWDIVCFGRSGSGERYEKGECRVKTEIVRDGTPLWVECGRLAAGNDVFSSVAGLQGRTVCGTFFATLLPLQGEGRDGGGSVKDVKELLHACRAERPADGEGAVTVLPSLFVARYLGDSSEAARLFFERLRHHVRPHVAQREAVTPRIWRT